MNDTALRIERIMDATLERVFAAWTTREAMERWFRDGDGADASVTELDLRVGGRYRVEFGPPGAPPYVEAGEFLELDPPRRLVMTQTLSNDGQTMWVDTKVTVELHDENGKTRCVLLHEGFPNREARDGAQGGWPGFLDRIDQYLTT